MRTRPSVILIREWEEQLSGSGCCGRVEGDFLTREGEPAFRERRACMEAMAPLSRTLRERFGDAIELQVVDPRNAFLIFLLLRDFWAFRVGLVEALKTIGGLPVQAVVVNGKLLSRGEWPDPLEVVQILEEAISAASSNPPETRLHGRRGDRRIDSAGVRDTGGMNQRVLPFIIGLLLLPMGCGDSTGPKLASVDVSPATTTLAVIGGTVQFTAVGRDLNGNAIVSGGFVWSSSDPQVATVGESSGLATAVANGITMISAGSPSLLGQSGSATLTVAAP